MHEHDLKQRFPQTTMKRIQLYLEARWLTINQKDNMRAQALPTMS